MKRAVVLLSAVAAGILMTALSHGQVPATGPAAVPATNPAAAKWSLDYKSAMDQAKKDNKLVLLSFTGSDWCEPCARLHAQVFESPEFAQWAHEKLVLVEVDFPNGKKLPDEVAKQNAALKSKYWAF